jgi:glycosyltransferase involved in cell wall biosynthesis
MKVAILVPGGLDRSGEQRVIPALLWLIERLAREVEVHAFAFAPAETNERYELRGAHVHAAGRGLRPMRAAAAILAEHARGRFDVLHAFWASRPGTVAVPLGLMLGIPVIVHLAGGETAALPDIGYGSLCRRRGRMVIRSVLRGASVVTAPSRPIVEAAAQLGCQAVRLPLGVAKDAWPPCPPRARDTTRPARLIHVASINHVKDPFTLLSALSRLAARGVDFTLDIIGVDTLHGEVQARAHSLGIADRVRFLGFRTQSEVRPLVLSADIMVMASRHEAGPIAVLEAAMSGVPVAGTAVGHLAEWAPNAAAVAPPGNAEALARAIESLLNDDARRLALARSAHLHAVSEDADYTAARVMALYHKLTNR